MSDVTPEAEPRKLAEEARDRVRFEEEALDLADQVYRVARRLVSTREEAEDLMQETYARAFRSWRSFQPGTNLRAWLFTILHNHFLNDRRRAKGSPIHVDSEVAEKAAAMVPADPDTAEDRLVRQVTGGNTSAKKQPTAMPRASIGANVA